MASAAATAPRIVVRRGSIEPCVGWQADWVHLRPGAGRGLRWQRDLSTSYARLALGLRNAALRKEAREALATGPAIVASLAAQLSDWSRLEKDPAWFDHQIAELHSEGELNACSDGLLGPPNESETIAPVSH
jgi:hypothetical protein